MRVRDEIRMTISAYQTLYESSIAYGMRKALTAEQYKAQMQAKVKSLQIETKEFEKSISEMEEKIDLLQKREKKAREEADRKHTEDCDVLRKHNEALRGDLEALLSIPKK